MADIRLTQSEAEARAALVSVERYDITLDFTGLLEGEILATTSTVTFTATTPGASTFADCQAVVTSATLNGTAIDLASITDGRIPLAGLEATNTLVVTSTQSNTAASEGVLKTVDASDGLVYVWTSLEPDDARRIFAGFDQPDLKAVFAFTAVVPDSWTALSNTGPVSDITDGSTRTIVFADSPRLSTYNMVVDAGPFHEERRIVTTDAGEYDLGFHARQSLVPLLQRDLDELVDITRHGLGWFGTRFGIAFPQRRYDQIFVPDMGGAMENWGAVTYTDLVLHRSEPTHAERAWKVEVMLHEMAHMWFGDLVTMRWWDDLWLNEAFATWASYWSMSGIPGHADTWAKVNVMSKLSAYTQDMSPGTHPIRGIVPDVAVATANFDAITYDKGMSVLHQLHTYIGEEAFLAGLRAHFRDHAYGNATLTDLMGAFGAAAGRDLTEWTALWLDHAGTDTITLTLARGAATGTTGAVSAASPDTTAPRPHAFDIASYADDGTLVATTPIRLESGAATVALPSAAAHQLNAGDLTFAATVNDPSSSAWLRDNTGAIEDALARTVSVTSAWTQMALGELDGPGFLALALPVLRAETNPAVVEELITLAARAAALWTPWDQLDAQQAALADTLVELTRTPDLAAPALRALTWVATTPAHFSALEGSGDTAVEWRLAARRSALGQLGADEVETVEARDPDPESWVTRLIVEAAAPTLEAKQAFWERMAVKKDLPRTENLYGMTRQAFWNPSQRELLAPFEGDYLEVVSAVSGGMLALGLLVNGMYPATAGRGFLTKAEALAQDETVTPMVRQQLLISNDRLERMLTARGE